MARVTLNGHEFGTLWKSPFRADITDAMKQGNNELTVEVANLWVNRLIGDSQFSRSDKNAAWLKAGKSPPTNALRKTFVAHSHYGKKDPLMRFGLLGPVTVFTVSR